MQGLRARILVGGGLLVIVLAIAVIAMKWVWPTLSGRRPALVEMPPLAPITRSSRIVLPATIALSAIADAVERAPRETSGKLELPMLPFGSGPQITWSMARGAFALAGGSEGLMFSTSLNGAISAPGGFGPPGGFGGGGFPGGFGLPPGMRPPPGFFGGREQSPPRGQAGADSEQGIKVSGNIELRARPTLQAAWRLQPNLVAQVDITDATASIMGSKLSLSKEMKPVVEKAINEKVDALQSWLADSAFLERAARQEWSKGCRSIPLGSVSPEMPNVWLEVRPTRVFAAQPVIDRSSVVLTFGVQAETRIVPEETRPDCPFPAQLDIVPQVERGHVSIAIPIDMPFTEIKRLMEAQLVGKTFPLDRSGAFTATVRGINIAASAGRLLLSLRVKANEHKSWFGLGTEVTVHLWGRPVLDQAQQVLRVADISLDVESEAAFGALGVAARPAMPYLERTLSENAVIDLKPIAANARQNIDKAIAEFEKSTEGVRVDASVNDLRLSGIEFDSRILRVIAEAEGTVKVAVTALPTQ